MATDELPQPDAGADESSGSDRRHIVVDDPEDFAKTRQLRAIFDARDDYIDARREANKAKEDGEIGFARRNSHVFRYLQDFAMTMEPLLKSHDKGREIWTDREYGIDHGFVKKENVADEADAKLHLIEVCESMADGNVTQSTISLLLDTTGVELPQRAVDQIMDRLSGMTADVQQQQQQQIDLPSDPTRADLLSLQSAIADQQQQQQQQSAPVGPTPKQVAGAIWKQINQQRGYQRDKSVHRLKAAATDFGWSVTGIQKLIEREHRLVYVKRNKPEFGETRPPEMVSNDAFRDLGDFIREAGLGVQFDEQQQTKIDDDLLKEVDEWRQTNIN